MKGLHGDQGPAIDVWNLHELRKMRLGILAISVKADQEAFRRTGAPRLHSGQAHEIAPVHRCSDRAGFEVERLTRQHIYQT